MISFEIKLTPHQIAVLKAVQMYTDSEDPGSGEKPYLRFSQFITTSRFLQAERFIQFNEHPRGQEAFKAHTITEKGRLVLRIIEIEIADVAEDLKALAADAASPSLPAQARGTSEPTL